VPLLLRLFVQFFVAEVAVATSSEGIRVYLCDKMISMVTVRVCVCVCSDNKF